MRPAATSAEGVRGFTKTVGWLKKLGWIILPFVVIILLWQLSAVASGLQASFYPRPLPAFAELWDILRKGILPVYAAQSLLRWGAGILCGVLLTVPLSILFGLSGWLREAFMPLINFFHAIVEMAWLPLFILWFGYGNGTIVLSITYVVFFPVLYNTMLGLQNVPEVTLNAARTLGASRWQVVREVLLPGALPNIINGLRIGAGFAFRGLIAAEILAATSGLGFMIFEARATQQIHRTVAGMIVIGLVWVAIDRLYLRSLENATIERWGLVRRST